MESDNVDRNKYTSLKYTTEFGIPSAYKAPDLHKAAIEYKKNVTRFNNELIGNEVITNKNIGPNENLIKDIFTPSGKFLSKRLLIWVNGKITYNNFKELFTGNLNSEAEFSEKTTSKLLKFLYRNHGIEANNEILMGKKVYLYIPKNLNTSIKMAKKLTIESSSAPIVLAKTTNIVEGEEVKIEKEVYNNLIRTNVYNVDLSNLNNVNNKKELTTNGAVIDVIREGSDVQTWVKNTYYKITERSIKSKQGWKKAIIDFPLYDRRLIDVYKIDHVSGVDDTSIEVTYPISVTLEDILTNPKLASFKDWMYDNVNLFNITLMRILKDSRQNLGQQGEALIALLAKKDMETTDERKKINHLSKTMSLYLGLKKKLVIIMRKIRKLTEAFSIKNLNDILKSVQGFNDKKLFTTKIKKTKSEKRKVPGKILQLTDLNGVCNVKWITLLKKFSGEGGYPFLGKDVKVSLSSPDEVKKTVRELFKLLEEGREMDSKTFYDVIDVDDVQNIIEASVVENDEEERNTVINGIGDKLLNLEKEFRKSIKDAGIGQIIENIFEDVDFDNEPFFLPPAIVKQAVRFMENYAFPFVKSFVEFIKKKIKVAEPSRTFKDYKNEDIEKFLREHAFSLIWGNNEDLHEDLYFLAETFYTLIVYVPGSVQGIEEVTKVKLEYGTERKTLFKKNDAFTHLYGLRGKMNILIKIFYTNYEKFLEVLYDGYYSITGKDLDYDTSLLDLLKGDVRVNMSKIASSLGLRLSPILNGELELIRADENETFKNLDTFLRNLSYFLEIMRDAYIEDMFELESLHELWKNNASQRKSKLNKIVRAKIDFKPPISNVSLVVQENIDEVMSTNTNTVMSNHNLS